MKAKRQPHVALIIETSQVFGRRILEGITQYLHSREVWSVFLEQRELFASPPRWLKDWDGDGMICSTASPQLTEVLRTRKMPVVNLNSFYRDLGLPQIWSDHLAIGRLAAEHLLERGFQHFAFCGFAAQYWSVRRCEGFAAAVQKAGFACKVYESAWVGVNARPWEQEQRRISEWLGALPKPVGIMACNDMRGHHVLDACRRVNLSVPEEVAVIGVDNDELLCELCHPPLSSVRPNPERIGYEAAQLLDQLMAGKRPRRREWLIEPLGVTTRQSTDMLAIEDRWTAQAVRYIREHACDGTTIADVLAHVPISRTLLERRFRHYLGRSPQAEIRSVQLKRTKQLLVESDLKMERIARLAGYKHPEYMSVVFKRETGLTPAEYRRRAQVSSPRISSNTSHNGYDKESKGQDNKSH